MLVSFGRHTHMLVAWLERKKDKCVSRRYKMKFLV